MPPGNSDGYLTPDEYREAVKPLTGAPDAFKGKPPMPTQDSEIEELRAQLEELRRGNYSEAKVDKVMQAILSLVQEREKQAMLRQRHYDEKLLQEARKSALAQLLEAPLPKDDNEALDILKTRIEWARDNPLATLAPPTEHTSDVDSTETPSTYDDVRAEMERRDMIPGEATALSVEERVLRATAPRKFGVTTLEEADKLLKMVKGSEPEATATCPRCKGKGYGIGMAPEHRRTQCGLCHGTGTVPTEAEGGN